MKDELLGLAKRARECADYAHNHPGHVETSGYAIADLYTTIGALAELTAQAIEARRAETGTGSVHESAVPKGCAQ